MRRILRQPDTQPDTWRYPGEPAEPGDPQVVPLATLLAQDPAQVTGAVLLTPADEVEKLAPYVGRLQLVVVEFPGPGEGRGFSQGRLLRQRLGFKGELRARGAGVKQDKIFLMARCGFDAFELPPTEKEDEARRALARYSVAYQGGDGRIPVRRRA